MLYLIKLALCTSQQSYASQHIPENLILRHFPPFWNVLTNLSTRNSLCMQLPRLYLTSCVSLITQNEYLALEGNSLLISCDNCMQLPRLYLTSCVSLITQNEYLALEGNSLLIFCDNFCSKLFTGMSNIWSEGGESINKSTVTSNLAVCLYYIN